MKKYLCALGFVFLSIGLNAQTKYNKLGFSGGFGFQQYQGDLGNGFYAFKKAKFGVGSINVGYYLNESFDIGLIGTLGDYGFCQTDKDANREIRVEDRCPGCIGRKGKGNLNSRMTSGGFIIKYKLANGILFSEKSLLKPYIYIGACVNHITDRMKMNCIVPGDYYSINGGLGFRYDINERFNLGLNFGFGCLTSDKADFMVLGDKDKYMQNSLTVGINLL